MRALAAGTLTIATAVLLLVILAPASLGHHDAAESGIEVVAQHGENLTWRGVAFTPSGDQAVLVGHRSTPDGTRDLVATWSPDDGLEIVRDRPGNGLVDVSIREDGQHLIVGLQDTLLLGQPGEYRNVWNESDFARADEPYTFYGLAGQFEPGEDHALIAGSSLLRMEADGSLSTVHGGQDAFFRTLDWNPRTSQALVEAAIEHDGPEACEGTGTAFGTLWRTDGMPPSQGDGLENVALYGNKAPGCGLANAIAHAPNGTFALVSGRDDGGASLYTWAPDRSGDDWRYQTTEKSTGPITCIAWHPSERYAITTGTGEDTVGLATDRSWTPLLHEGPDLQACAMHPDGDLALAVGEEGSIVRIPHDPSPMVTVVHPAPGSLVAPQEDQRFLLDIVDRGGAGNVSLSASVFDADTTESGFLSGPWWEVRMDTRNLSQGQHQLAVSVSTDAGQMRVTHPFLVNPDRFTPETPTILEPAGLEGDGHSTTGTFTIRWEPLDEPVHYQVRQEHEGEGSNATRILDAGDADRLTVQVHEEGMYTFSVRALNAFNASTWSSNVVVNVVFDDGAPSQGERDFRQCPSPDEAGDVSWRECVLGVEQETEQPNQTEDPPETNGSDDPSDGEQTIPATGVAILAPALASVLAGAAEALRSRPR